MYVRFVHAHPHGAVELVTTTTLPANAIPRTGDHIDLPGEDQTGWDSVVEKVSWFYTRESGLPKMRDVGSVWVYVNPKKEGV